MIQNYTVGNILVCEFPGGSEKEAVVVAVTPNHLMVSSVEDVSMITISRHGPKKDILGENTALAQERIVFYTEVFHHSPADLVEERRIEEAIALLSAKFPRPA